MSDTSYGTATQPWQTSSPTAGPQDVVIQLQGIVQQLSNLVAAFKALGAIAFGTITLSAGTTTTVAQSSVQANSQITLTPTNASAAVLFSYISAIVPGTSFTITTTTAAAGTETFTYSVNSPV